MKYDIKFIEKVVEEYNKGKNKKQLSREFNIPRATVIYWTKLYQIIDRNPKSDKSLETIQNEIINNTELYNFILGLYLGDGCISANKMSYRLRIVQDSRYPNSVIEIQKSLEKFFNKKSTLTKSKGCEIITIFDKNLPLYFPQHQSGKKHDRLIELTGFQKNCLNYQSLLKGLWVTDGSYYRALVGKYEYERYNFTNKSHDIILIFEECLNSLEIKYVKRQKKNEIWIIEIQKKSEVDKMKKVVGVKS